VFGWSSTGRLGRHMWQRAGGGNAWSRLSPRATSWGSQGSRLFSSQASDPLSAPITEPPSPPPGRPTSFWRILTAAASTRHLQRDEVSSSMPRQKSIDYLRKMIRENGATGKETVGSGVLRAVQSLKFLHGELGGRNVHEVFENPALKRALLTEQGHPDFDASHRLVAGEERAYWQREHAKDPSPGTEAGSGVDEQTRVAIQKAFGRLRNPYGGAKLWRDCRRPGASGPVTVEETPRAVHYEGFAVFSLFRLFLRVRAR
jgi:hypothetical protein